MMHKLLLLLMLAVLIGGYFFYDRMSNRDTSYILANQGLPTVQMKLGDQTFTLEVASTETQRQTGLMYRDSMPNDRGMIFVFSEDQPLMFWMKNTRIPLDILYVDAQGAVVSTHTMKPFDLNTTNSDGPAKWAIELNEGMIAKLGLKKGDKLEIPEKARDSKE